MEWFSHLISFKKFYFKNVRMKLYDKNRIFIILYWLSILNFTDIFFFRTLYKKINLKLNE